MTAPPLTPLETVSGIVLGSVPGRQPDSRGLAPRAALEEALLPPLRRGPCLVSFSGGRDSSAVLATATVVARREGLPEPVPATLRFPGAEKSAESEWQEHAVRHLGLEDWIRFDVTSELDCVGPVAGAALARHGLLWPCNAHFHGRVLAAARGGSLLRGIGGDDLLGASRWAHQRRVLARRRPAGPRDLIALAFALAPAALRRPVVRRRLVAPFPWLRPEAVDEIVRQLAVDEAAEPFAWGAGTTWRARRRYLDVGTASLRALAADEDVLLVHPLLDPAFVGALASVPRPQRYWSRRQAMDYLFHDVLPSDLRARRTKASFDGAFWHEHSRELVRRWDGGGVDESLVDVDALAAEWRSQSPDPRTFTLLQSLRLRLEVDGASGGGDLQQGPPRFLEAVPAVGAAELPRRQASELEHAVGAERRDAQTEVGEQSRQAR